MSRFCQKHARERTNEELEARLRELRERQKHGESLGPGLQRERQRIINLLYERERSKKET